MTDTLADLGVFGMGVMGSNLALNFAENGGFTVALFNRETERSFAVQAENPELADRLVPTASLQEFVAALKSPRVIVLMIVSGAPIDEQLANLRPLLGPDDIVIDAGNSDFLDTVRRSAAHASGPFHFVGMGVSGGEEGARHGASMMVGGDKAVWESRLKALLQPVSAKFQGEACVEWMGPGGAGHFVKTIHNGIEYADMQMIAEIYGILRDGAGLGAGQIAPIFADWNTRALQSYLIEITAQVLAEPDAETGKPLVDVITDEAGQKGTGRWAVIEAQKLGVGATTLEAAVSARGVSSRRAERQRMAELYPAADVTPAGFTADAPALTELEAALTAAKIIAYTQGFAAMAAASAEYGWDLPLAGIARIWRAGCIIRSQFLDDIASAFEASPGLTSLLQAPEFVDRMTKDEGPLRRVAARAIGAGIPVPAMAAGISYFDDSRRARGTANLIQGQRDLFGAHTFTRLDREGVFHHEWAHPDTFDAKTEQGVKKDG